MSPIVKLLITSFFSPFLFPFFFFNDTATTEIYTLSLHDALPIFPPWQTVYHYWRLWRQQGRWEDRKSTRLNSSHVEISYAVFCLKKKKEDEFDPFQKWRLIILGFMENPSVKLKPGQLAVQI